MKAKHTNDKNGLYLVATPSTESMPTINTMYACVTHSIANGPCCSSGTNIKQDNVMSFGIK